MLSRLGRVFSKRQKLQQQAAGAGPDSPYEVPMRCKQISMLVAFNILVPGLTVAGSVLLLPSFSHPGVKLLIQGAVYLAAGSVFLSCRMLELPRAGAWLGAAYLLTPQLFVLPAMGLSSALLCARLVYAKRYQRMSFEYLANFVALLLVHQVCLLILAGLTGNHIKEMADLEHVLQ
jgi:hypothetical protein